MTTWDPDLYLEFSGPRKRAALDLLDRVPPMEPKLIYDLGCGTGNITRVMATRFPEAQVVGIDNSPDMLEMARGQTARQLEKVENEAERQNDPRARIEWRRKDIATWSADKPADLIYSNATLHWLGDHERLLSHLVDQLQPGGFLAVQMPLSWYARSHELMREVLASGGEGGTPLGDEELRAEYGRPPVMQPEEYYDFIAPLVERVDIWKTEYLHILEGRHPVFDWVAGAGLRPILQKLEGEQREHFLFGYRDRVREAYPENIHGQTLYPFPRLFIVATS